MAAASRTELSSTRLERWGHAGADAVLALGFLLTWANPRWLGYNALEEFYYVGILQIVAFLVHVGYTIQLGQRRPGLAGRWTWFAVAATVATVFHGLAAVDAEGLWPLVALVPVLGYLVSVARRGRATSAQAGYLAVSLAGLLGGWFLGVLPPWPAWGVDEMLRAEVDFLATGNLVDEPHRVLVFGLIFFTLRSVVGFLWEPEEAAVRDPRRR